MSVPTPDHSSKPPISAEGEDLQLRADEAKGATIHTFDPLASPSEKAAAARKAASASLAPVDLSGFPPSLRGGEELAAFKEAGGSAVPSDVGTATGGAGTPKTTTSLREVEAVNKEEKAKEAKEEEQGKLVPSKEQGGVSEIEREEGRVNEDGSKNPPGALPGKEAEKPGKPAVREIPAWFAIGWTGQDKTLFLSPEEAHERSVLQDFFSDAYYGQWYHNAGIILFAILASHFLTLLGGGWGWLIVVAAICTTYYETSVKRVRRNARDDAARVVEKKGLRGDVETAGWINHFMQRFWLIYEPVLSSTIVASVDQVLSVSTPAFLDSIRMTTFTLGTKPPHIDHVKTFPDTEDDIVIMEWRVSFTPNDLSDLTHAQAAKKVNPKIVLEVRFGVGPASVGKDIVVEDLMFAATMRIKLKLMNNFPHVKSVDLSFMQPPQIDFALKPVGFDLSMLPGISGFIDSTLHSSLAPMMYDPNSFTLDLEQMMSGAPADTAVGVLAVTVHGGKGLRSTKLGGGAPDPYVAFSISGRAELARTKTKLSTSTPHWNETHHLLLNTLNDTLTMTVFDWNEHRSDNILGTVTFDLKSLADDGEQLGLSGDVIYDGKPRGNIRFDVNYFPVIVPNKLADGTLEPVPETTSGIVRLVVHQAKDLDPRGQQINPFFRVTLNSKPVHRSQTLKRTPSPIWERPVELLITAKPSAVLGLSVLDDNTLISDTRLGNLSVKLSDILEANKRGDDWFPLSNARSGKVRITAEWKPVLMAGAINGAGAYTPPIGVIRLYFKRCRDLKNVEGVVGKSDPFIRVLSKGVVVVRTMVHESELNPDFDEIHYVAVHSPRDVYTIDVLDYERSAKHRPLGSTEINARTLVAEGPDKKTKPWIGTGVVEKKELLKSHNGKSVKGTIEYSAEFFPCAHLKDISFTPPEQQAIKLTELDESSSGSSSSSSSEDAGGAGAATPTTASFGSSPPNGPPALPTAVNGKIKEKENGAGENEDTVSIPREELLRSQTGLLVFQIIGGQLARKGARIEVLLDDGYWPTYSTEASRSTHATFDEIGEVVVRELDFSQITLALNTAAKHSRGDVIAQTAPIEMKDFLEQALDRAATFTLPATDGTGRRSTVQIMAKYIPIDMHILPKESINNSGVVRVDLLDGSGLPSADRNGKSDPYCVFLLNDERVYKSEVIKKTLAPVWNEKFEMAVPSREKANFLVEVHDWDRVGTSDKLGFGSIDLRSIEPYESSERVVVLQDFKTGAQAGQIRVRMVFTPSFLRKERVQTSTIQHLPGRIGSTLGGGAVAVGGAAIGGVGTVGGAAFHGAGAVGKAGAKGVAGVGKGVFGLGRRVAGGGHKRADSVPSTFVTEDEALAPQQGNVVPGSPAASQLEVLAGSPNPAAIADAALPGGREGTLTIVVHKLSGVGEADAKKVVETRWNGKRVHETHSHKGTDGVVDFNETFTVKTSDGPTDLAFLAQKKRTLGSDHTFATANVPNIWQHIGPTSPQADLNLDLGGGGQLAISLEWIASPSFLTTGSRAGSDAGDNHSIYSTNGTTSPASKTRSRFSSGRFGRHTRENTPSVAE
ncbi:hypothetical protein JCM11251_007345 [Rhodosporidiobolus azoricus]